MSLDFTKYKNTLSYPKKITTFSLTSLEMALKNNVITKEEYDSKLDAHNKEKFIYDLAVSAYYQEDSRLHEQFKKDLFEEYGVADNSKVELLYSKVYELGHSGGFQEIECYFGDLVDLIL
jgi:hypothetical protein